VPLHAIEVFARRTGAAQVNSIEFSGTGKWYLVNPFAVNLDENITRLKLDVKQIAALHGLRLATIADLKAFIQK
jgi:hypothetical protein